MLHCSRLAPQHGEGPLRRLKFISGDKSSLLFSLLPHASRTRDCLLMPPCTPAPLQAEPQAPSEQSRKQWWSSPFPPPFSLPFPTLPEYSRRVQGPFTSSALSAAAGMAVAASYRTQAIGTAVASMQHRAATCLRPCPAFSIAARVTAGAFELTRVLDGAFELTRVSADVKRNGRSLPFFTVFIAEISLQSLSAEYLRPTAAIEPAPDSVLGPSLRTRESQKDLGP